MKISSLSASQLRRAAAIKEELDSLESELAKILGNGSTKDVVSGPKRKMSAAARARIVAAQKARWAKFHAAKKKK